MLGVLAMLFTVYLCTRHNNKVEEKNKKLANSSKSSTSFSSGYDPVRQVHWTKRDTWDISDY